MTQLTHSEARSLLSRALDASLSGGERRALDEHLMQCEACSAYAADLQRMNAHLFESLQTRWADPNLSSLEMDRSLRLTGQRVRQRSTGRRLMLVAQPAVWTIGAVALVAAMAWIISSIRPTPNIDLEGSPTPTTESQATATQAGIIASTPTGEPTRGICTAQVKAAADLREGPNEGYLSTRTVYPGITGQVLSIFWEGDTAWLQVYFRETATLEYVGWLPASSVDPTGDCKAIIQYTPTSTPESATATAQSQNNTADRNLNSTATPVIDPSGVCYVAAGESGPVDLNIYDGPGTMYPVIGTLTVAESAKATGIFSQENYPTFVRIEHKGLVGWVEAGPYMFDGRGTQGCWPLEPVTVNPLPPTNTPSPTWQPTSTADPAVNTNDIIYVVPDAPNNVGTYSGSLPLSDGTTTTYVGIRVNNIPQDMGYHLAIRVECSGASTDHFRWDYYGLPVTLDRTCGMTLGTPVSQSDNFRTLILGLPDGGPAVSFTITVTVEP